MVWASGTSFSFVPLALNAAQSATQPVVQFGKDVGNTVFEVFHPSSNRPVGGLHYLFHRSRSASASLLANGFLELIHALLTRPTMASLEVVAQEIESSSLTNVHQTRLGWMQD